MQTLKDKIQEQLHDARIDLRHTKLGIFNHGSIAMIEKRIKILETLLNCQRWEAK